MGMLLIGLLAGFVAGMAWQVHLTAKDKPSMAELLADDYTKALREGRVKE